MLKVEGLKVEVPGRSLVEGGSLRLERDEHVVLVGPNGAGKTTLIDTLAGTASPTAARSPTGHNVHLGYLSQHATTAAGEGTVLDAVVRETGLTGQKARDLLGAFLFSGSDAMKQLSDISGGEQRRLSLAILVSSGANVLILDEPTNHLDVESREALEDALLAFEGAVILVSHDRALLEAVGSAAPSSSRRGAGEPPRRLGDLPARGRRARRGRRGRDRVLGKRRPPSRRRNGRSRRAPPRTRCAGCAISRPRSSGPRQRCASSRRSWPTPAPGRAPAAPSGRPSATRPRRHELDRLMAEWEEAQEKVGVG